MAVMHALAGRCTSLGMHDRASLQGPQRSIPCMEPSKCSRAGTWALCAAHGASTEDITADCAAFYA